VPLRSTRTKAVIFPVTQVVRNFYFSYTKSPLTDDNDIWVGYHLGKQDYPLNDLSFFKTYIEEGEGLLEDDKLEYHFMNIPTEFEIEDHIDQTIKHLVKGKFKDLGEIYFKEAGEILKEEIQINEYDSYLFIKLTTPVQTANPVETLDLFKQMLGQTFKNIAGQDSNAQRLLSFYIRKEKQLYENLLNYKKIRRLTEEDYERITYYQFHRANPRLPERRLLPQEINEGIVTNERGYVKIEQLDKTHYSAFISLFSLPSSIMGSAIIQNIQDSVNFKIETHQRIRFEHPKRDLSKLRKMRKRILEQNKDMDSTDAILDDDEVLLYGDERLRDLNNELKKKVRRLCHVTLTLVISADSKELLDERVKDLEFVLDGTDFKIYRSVADQLTLFNQSLIGSKYAFKSFEQVLTTGYLADLGMNLTKTIGNRYGMPLGRVITSKKFTDVKQALSFSSNIVWFYPNLTKKAIEGAVHTNGNTLITGPPGMGKSVLVKYIFMWLTFLGQKVLYVDPKNETERFFAKALEKYGHLTHFQEMYRRINFITLSEDENYRGILDPLIFLPKEQGIQTARTVLQKLAEINKNPETYTKKKTTINHAVNAVAYSEGKKNLTRVIDKIEETDTEMADLLRGFNVGISKVLIGTDTSKAIRFEDQINVLGIQGLKMPSEKEVIQNELDNEQIASSVIMEVIMKLTYIFSTDKDEDACIIYDEAKGLEDTPQGSFLIEDSLRKGRANNTDIYLVTQAFMDYDREDKKELISYKFAFKPKQEQAQRKILQFFNMEDNEGNMELIQSLVSGTCLFQDHLGRNQAIAIDVMFDSWLAAISSTDKESEDIQIALQMEQGKAG
jgi:type IV secretory pathway VirB4 component